MKQTLLLFLLLASFPTLAQKQAWNWFFGQKHGLDFSKGDPVYKAGGMTRLAMSYTAVSDSAGRLLFYTDHRSIYAANHKPMLNGDTVADGREGYMGMLIVPKPGSSSIFYLFCTEGIDNYGGFGAIKPRGFRYSVVDMCLDSGRGAVVPGQKYLKIRDSIADRLDACIDAAGTGYWIVSHEPVGNRYLSWHLTATGLSASPVISAVGSNLDPNRMHSGFGNLQLSPAGGRLAMTVPCDDPDVVFEVCNFNNATGAVSSPTTINLSPTASTGVIVNLAFAPESGLLYVLTVNNLYQFNTSSAGSAAILSSKQLIWHNTKTFGNFRGLQLGPDGKMYFGLTETTNPAKNTIHRLRKPSVPGTGCDLDSNYLVLPSTTPGNLNLLPNFPHFTAGLRYRNAIPCAPAAGVHQVPQTEFSISPNPATDRVSVRVVGGRTMATRELQLFDVSGRRLAGITLREAINDVDLRTFRTGIYFYRLLENGQSVNTGKLILR